MNCYNLLNSPTGELDKYIIMFHYKHYNPLSAVSTETILQIPRIDPRPGGCEYC